MAGKCIRFETSKQDYLNAVISCATKGAELVSIESDKSQEALTSFSGSIPMWIGLSDIREEGVFQWLNGSSLYYSNWGLLQPDGGNREHCVLAGADGKWEDTICGRKEAFMCQQSKNEEGPRARGKRRKNRNRQ